MNKKNLIAILLFVATFWLVGFNKYYQNPPDGIHLGAQTDRATLTYNFYNGSATFLYPRVMETRISDGIAGCEFPIIYYSLGNLFKAIGFRYDVYRVVIWLFYLLALWSMFNIAKLYLTDNNALLITGIVGFSPILSFYSLNFLSDVPALGLSLLGWWLVLKNRKTRFTLILGLLVMALAGLLKASYAMHIAVAFTVFVLDKRKIKYPALLLVLIYSIGFYWLLYPNLSSLAVPVLIYSVLISLMLVACIHAFDYEKQNFGWVCLAGTILFAVSDSILAFNRFVEEIPLGGVLVILL